MIKKQLVIEVVLSSILILVLLLCLFKMPYGYYQFVRIVSFALFGYLAYVEWKRKKIVLFLVFLVSCLLFNPFKTVALGREIWQIVDVVLSIILAINLFVNLFQERRKRKGASL